MSTQNLTDDRRGRLNYFTTDRSRALTFASNHSVSEVNCRAEVDDAARMDRNEVQA